MKRRGFDKNSCALLIFPRRWRAGIGTWALQFALQPVAVVSSGQNPQPLLMSYSFKSTNADTMISSFRAVNGFFLSAEQRGQYHDAPHETTVQDFFCSSASPRPAGSRACFGPFTNWTCSSRARPSTTPRNRNPLPAHRLSKPRGPLLRGAGRFAKSGCKNVRAAEADRAPASRRKEQFHRLADFRMVLLVINSQCPAHRRGNLVLG